MDRQGPLEVWAERRCLPRHSAKSERPCRSLIEDRDEHGSEAAKTWGAVSRLDEMRNLHVMVTKADCEALRPLLLGLQEQYCSARHLI